MTEYVLMNKQNGMCGLGIKLLLPHDLEPTVDSYSISLASSESFVWAIKLEMDQPYIVVFNSALMDELENLGEL